MARGGESRRRCCAQLDNPSLYLSERLSYRTAICSPPAAAARRRRRRKGSKPVRGCVGADAAQVGSCVGSPSGRISAVLAQARILHRCGVQVERHRSLRSGSAAFHPLKHRALKVERPPRVAEHRRCRVALYVIFADSRCRPRNGIRHGRERKRLWKACRAHNRRKPLATQKCEWIVGARDLGWLPGDRYMRRRRLEVRAHRRRPGWTAGETEPVALAREPVQAKQCFFVLLYSTVYTGIQ